MFYAVVGAMIALALLVLLPTLLRLKNLERTDPTAVDAARANLQVLREQLAALDAEHAAGGLDAEQHRLARIEIERRALEEAQIADKPRVVRRAHKTAALLTLFVPVLVIGLYFVLGNQQALSPMAATSPDQAGHAQLEPIVAALAKRLQTPTTPEEDLKGWAMLASSYAVMERFEDASKAFARARELAPDDAQLMVDHADVLAMLQGRKFDGEPGRLVMQALQIDPQNVKALAMAGSWAFNRGDFAEAAKYWEQALTLLPPGSEFANSLTGSIQQARAASGQAPMTATAALAALAAPTAPTAPAAPAAPVAPAKPAAGADAASATTTTGLVKLAPALTGKILPTDTVFVFARLPEGPRMPLAIVRRQAADLPFDFTLDDSSAMAPQFKISGFPSVMIGVRVSRTGQATPSSGDLVGQIGPVKPGASKLVLVIDGMTP